MKTIFTLLASFIVSASVFAAGAKPRSSVTIKSVDNSNIRVELDGKRFEPNDNSLMIDGVAEGSHTLRVYKQQNNGLLSILSKRYTLAYSSTINVKKRTQLFITIERNGRISMQENKIKKNQVAAAPGYGQGGQWGSYDNHAGYESGMSNGEFTRVLQSVDKEWLESNKIKSATQVVRTNNLTTAQVKQLVQLFSFENNKLELAKVAYANTVDKRNYSMISDLFSFNSSKVELERYIRNFR